MDFMKVVEHDHKHTPASHLQAFYKCFADIADSYYDGMIITGAPVEQLPFEEVTYWEELTRIFEWTRTHVTSTLYICWAAQAGLHYFYGIPKYGLEAKMFGVFEHKALAPELSIFRGFDDVFYVPHSRHTELHREDILGVPSLRLLSESEEAGVYMVMGRNGREFFITGHSEYSPETLHSEYMRDIGKGLPIALPKHYYAGDDPCNAPEVRWRSHAYLLFSNWLNYYVYQETPYHIEDIGRR
jgi:homoserine O-succinyltransferase